MTDIAVSKAVIAIIARALFTASEHKTAQYLNDNSALMECMHYDKKVTHKQLYSIADKLYSHKTSIDSFINQRVDDLFDLEDRLVIYDISNTYFETRKANSKLADFGRSKEKRNDCPMVVFTGVINAKGFMIHSRIYHGKKADTTTLEDMLYDLELNAEKTNKNRAQKTVVIDAGIASEGNLKLLRERKYKYVCVSRKRIKDYPTDDIKKTTTLKKDSNTLKLKIFRPQNEEDTWMYVKSNNKAKKELPMQNKLHLRYHENLQTIKSALDKKGGTKKIEKVWERIGIANERHKMVSHQYTDCQCQAKRRRCDKHNIEK